MPVFNEQNLLFNQQPMSFHPTVSTLTYDELFKKMNQPNFTPDLIENNKPQQQQQTKPEITKKSKTNVYNMLNIDDEPPKQTTQPPKPTEASTSPS